MTHKGNRPSDTARPAVEWIVGALSCVMVVTLIAFLLYQALFHDGRPPDLSIVIEAVEQTGSGTVVRVAVANAGDEAAAGVRVYAARTDAPDHQMRNEIEFDYVAGHAVRRGAFVFRDATIRPDSLDVEIGGFVEP